MPWAGNDGSLERALTQRPSPVKAGIADSVKLAAYIGHGDGDPLQKYFADLTWNDLGGLRYTHKRHGTPLQRPALHGMRGG
jgi:hypothetical protein